MADNPVTTIDDVRRFLRGKKEQEAPDKTAPLSPMPDTERAEFQKRIANLLDENTTLRAERDSLKERLEPKNERDALPRGVPRMAAKEDNVTRYGMVEGDREFPPMPGRPLPDASRPEGTRKVPPAVKKAN